MSNLDADRRALELFAEVCDLAEPELSEMIARLSRGDASIAARVRQLVAADRADEVPLAEDATDGGAMLASELASGGMPERVGRYTLIRELGRGGMGVVYEAEQESPRRRVALNVTHRWLMSDRVLRRFDRESQVLGRLDHPGIARIFEAGAARVDGQSMPFLAMELVDGMPIDAFIRDNDLTTRETIELVSFVCDAIHHAHQRGVIHRDIKPGNVMISTPAEETSTHERSDASVRTWLGALPASGCPKVLDFGVAKLTERDQDAGTLDTMAGHFVGTPAYMSPEQLESGSADADTRNDVYSIGVMLYSLIGGRLPVDLTGVPVMEAAQRIRTSNVQMLGELVPVCRGDVETIVHKAMDPDRDRRYSSVAGLAEDLRRFLNNEPIEARPSSTLYKLRKFAKRNRELVWAGGVVAATLIAAATIALYFAVSERSARQDAVRLAAASAIAAADAALREQDTATAALRLESVDPGERNWVWQYLWARKDQSVAVASLGEPDDPIGSEDRRFGQVHVWQPPGTDIVRVARYAMGDMRVQSHRAASLELLDTSLFNDVRDAARTLSGGFVVRSVDVEEAIEITANGERRTIASPKLVNRLRYVGIVTAKIHAALAAPTLQSGWVSTSEDGRWLYVWEASDGSSTLFDLEGVGKRLAVPHEPEGIGMASFSPDGKWMATGGVDRKLKCYSLGRDAQLSWELEDAHADAILAVAWSPDGTLIATGGQDAVVRLWDARSGDSRGSLLGHRGPILGMTFGESANTLFTASADEVRSWDMSAVDHRGSLWTHDWFLNQVAMSPCGSMVAVGGRGAIALLDPLTGVVLGRLGAEFIDADLRHLAFSADGRRLGWALIDGSVQWLSLVDGSLSERPASLDDLHGRRSNVNAPPDADSDRLLQSERSPYSPIAYHQRSGMYAHCIDGKVRVIDRRERVVACEINETAPTVLEFLDGGRFLAIGIDGSGLNVYEVASGRLALSHGLQGSIARAIAENPSEGLIAVGTDDRRILVYEGLLEEFLGELRGHRDRVTACVFNPDGTRLISVSDDYTAEAWRTVPASIIYDLQRSRDEIVTELSRADWSDVRHVIESPASSEMRRQVAWQVLAGRAMSLLERKRRG